MWIGKSNHAYSDELFLCVHVRGRLMEGVAAGTTEATRGSAASGPSEAEGQRHSGLPFFPGQVADK